MDKNFTSYRIEERSFVAYLKREIHGEVARSTFSESRAGEIDIIVSEICSNIIKHVGSGEILYRVQLAKEETTFEILSIDQGPGIADVSRMMRDGVSTASTLGHGLGAIERLSNTFNIYSIPEWGTIVYSKVSTLKPLAKKEKEKETLQLDVRGLCVCKARETFCGDGYQIKQTPNDIRVFFGDGLGHGPHAHDAVRTAADFFFESNETNPVDMIRQMHERVRKTRGLVATIAILDRKQTQWQICGVGNILTRIYQGVTYKNYMSYNGAIGLNIPTSLNYSVVPAERNQLLVMASDGIKTRWDISKFHSILKYDNMILAGAIYKEFNRGTDDSSVLTAKVVSQ
jgi:anti-sigma regulatory factor (Ser/Thr protein kinase)